MGPRYLIFIAALLACAATAQAQRFNEPALTVKTNILSASAGTINLAVEFVLKNQRTFDDDRMTVSLPIAYNPFTFSDNKKVRHVAFQPELRIHRPVSFGSVFLGLNALYAVYNVGGVNIPFNLAKDLKIHRYQGQLFGGGISGGYYVALGNYIGLEGAASAGYAYMDHIIYKCPTCGTKVGAEKKNYFGLTKAALSLVYTLK